MYILSVITREMGKLKTWYGRWASTQVPHTVLCCLMSSRLVFLPFRSFALRHFFVNTINPSGAESGMHGKNLHCQAMTDLMVLTMQNEVGFTSMRSILTTWAISVLTNYGNGRYCLGFLTFSKIKLAFFCRSQLILLSFNPCHSVGKV